MSEGAAGLRANAAVSNGARRRSSLGLPDRDHAPLLDRLVPVYGPPRQLDPLGRDLEHVGRSWDQDPAEVADAGSTVTISRLRRGITPTALTVD